MSDGFDLLSAASGDATNDSDANGGSDFLARFGAVDVSGGSDGGGSGSGGGDDFDPAIHVGRDKRNADGSYTRKRGRKSTGTRAGNSGPRVSKSASSVKAIQNSLEGIHALIAAATGFEDLRLAPEESEPLAGAIAEVGKHYAIPVVDPKIMAIGALVFVGFKVYSPKAALIKMELDERRKKAKAKKETQGTDNVLRWPITPATPEFAAFPDNTINGDFQVS